MDLPTGSQPNKGQQQCPCKQFSSDRHKATVVLGSQWGDEGKGKVVDMLAVNSDIVCRCQVPVSVNFPVFLLIYICPA